MLCQRVDAEAEADQGPVGLWAAPSPYLLLLAAGSAAQVEGVVPVEGGWVATTSAGLPVSFVVLGGLDHEGVNLMRLAA